MIKIKNFADHQLIYIFLFTIQQRCTSQFLVFIEDTPSRISIHEVDQGIDTGKILYQKKNNF